MKSVLCNNHRTLVKKSCRQVRRPMGAYDSAQVADLVGIDVLDMLGRIVNLEQVGLYQDDGIIFIPDSNRPKTSNIQMKIKAFKLLGLRNQIASNLKIVNFIDVTIMVLSNLLVRKILPQVHKYFLESPKIDTEADP